MISVAALFTNPFVLTIVLIVLLISAFQFRRFLGAVGASEVRAERDVGRVLLTVHCGFRVNRPGTLSVGYPMGQLYVGDERIVLCSPLGDFSFKISEVEANPLHRTLMFQRLRLLDAGQSATLLLRGVRAGDVAAAVGRAQSAGPAGR